MYGLGLRMGVLEYKRFSGCAPARFGGRAVREPDLPVSLRLPLVEKLLRIDVAPSRIMPAHDMKWNGAPPESFRSLAYGRQRLCERRIFRGLHLRTSSMQNRCAKARTVP